jgi:hypothetical protein
MTRHKLVFSLMLAALLVVGGSLLYSGCTQESQAPTPAPKPAPVPSSESSTSATKAGYAPGTVTVLSCKPITLKTPVRTADTFASSSSESKPIAPETPILTGEAWIRPAGSDKTVLTPVEVVLTPHEITGRTKRPDGDQEWTREYLCYEVRSTDKRRPFSWWLAMPYSSSGPLSPDHHRLIQSTSQRTRLVADVFLSLEFWDISDPRDLPTAVADWNRWPTPPYVRCDVDRVLPRELFGRLDGTFDARTFPYEVTVRSIEQDEAGHWIVGVSGPQSPEVYTLICEDGKWRRVDASAPPPAAK